MPSFFLLSSFQMKEELLDEILEDMKLLINVRFLEVGHTTKWYTLSK